ncbi:MAG: sensor histidine kinase [Aestuariivirga sp.]
MFANLQKKWSKLSLARQFMTVATTVLVPGMLTIGWWISNQISEAVTRNTAAAIVIYMDGLLAPLVAEIRSSGGLSLASQEKLDNLLSVSRADSRIVSMKVWKTDGTIIYSSFHDMIGKKFPLSEDFKKALSGEFGANFESVPHAEDFHERSEGKELLEVYAPVRESKSREIVAISEFYANGNQLGRDVWQATLTSWAIVIGVTGLMVLLLSGIVARGSRTIVQQQQMLARQVYELQGLVLRNEGLQASLRKANENVANTNERVLRQVGSDLHDGPAQMLAYVLMKLSKLHRFLRKDKAGEVELKNVSRILGDTLRDVRNASTGLMLPELEQATINEAIALAVKAHEGRTQSKVEILLDSACVGTTTALKICAYRLVQESLNNAFKHAGGKGQKVMLRCSDGVEISVLDLGGGITKRSTKARGLGLLGMRSRVEAIGGSFEILSPPSGGTIIRARFAKPT